MSELEQARERYRLHPTEANARECERLYREGRTEPHVYKIQVAVSPETMLQTRAFEEILDLKLARLKRQVMADRQKLLDERGQG